MDPRQVRHRAGCVPAGVVALRRSVYPLQDQQAGESGRGSSVFDRSRRREDPLAHKRAARRASTKAGGLAAVGSPVGGDPRARSDSTSRENVPVVPYVASGLASASSPVAPRGLSLDELRDGTTVCIELRGAGSGASDGWSEGFLSACIPTARTRPRG